MLLCLCKPSGFYLSTLLPSGVELPITAPPPLPAAVRPGAVAPLDCWSWASHRCLCIPCPQALLCSSDCPVLCLLGVTSPAVSQAPLRGLLHSSPGNPDTPQGGIWARTSPLLFRGMDKSLDLPIKELKLPTGTPHSFLSPPPLWKTLSNPGFNWATSIPKVELLST